MKQAFNPFLPLNEYIPDGEPHVFGDRVYLFGSHDEANADTYCALGYRIYSAPVSDLSNWTSKGINYTADQDPLSEKTGRHYLYAPDCVRGNDGRYYLYYALSGEKGSGIYSAAICCNLTNGHMPHGNNSRKKNIPMVYDDAGRLYIRNLTKNTKAVYKYFDLSNTHRLSITARGNGVVEVRVNGAAVSECAVCSSEWRTYPCTVSGGPHAALEFRLKNGKADILEFYFE